MERGTWGMWWRSIRDRIWAVDRRTGGPGRGIGYAVGALVVAATLGVTAFPPVARALVQYTVAPGDTLWSVAERHGTSVAALISGNDIADPDLIRVGQVLTIDGGSPPGTSPASYTVQPGDTLSGIADALGTTAALLVEVNNIADPNHIMVGQVLYLGSAGGGQPTGMPDQVTHRVVSGETLSGIAARYGVSLAALAAANGIQDVNLLVEGAVLTVPGPGAVPAVADMEEVLRAAAREFGVEESLVLALAWQESGWNQSMVSGAGAIGVMQVMPATGDWAAADLIGGAYAWRTDARDNARVGVAVLHNLLVATEGDVALALAGYYQGLQSVTTYGWFEDTRQYVENVLALAQRMG